MDESANTPEHDRPLDVPGPRDPTAPPATELGHEIEDEGPEPHIDADLDARVRELLADAPDPGPMPDEVAERISRALLARRPAARGPRPARARQLETPRDGRTVARAPASARCSRCRREPDDPSRSTSPPRSLRPPPSSPWGPQPCTLTKRPNGAAAVGDTYGSGVSRAVERPSSAPSCPVQPTGHAVRPAHPAQHDGILRRQARRAGEDAPRPPRSADPRPGGRVTGRRSHRHPHRASSRACGRSGPATAPTRRPRPCRPTSRPSTDTPRSWSS